MRGLWLCLVLVVAGCPAVQIDNPNVNVGENAKVDVEVSDKPKPDSQVSLNDQLRPDAGTELTPPTPPAETQQAPIEATKTDFDGDGIPDEIDPCPIDSPNDTDHDGKCDSQDPCPLDPFDDRDGDGICDSVDACPDGGDTDGDGLCDDVDPCPHDAPNDSDNDGKCDSVDPCPMDALDDSDGDGVCDSMDKCAGFDDRVDVDHDTIPDDCDPCLETGVDGDRDGIADACEQILWTLRAQTQLTLTPIGAVSSKLTIRLPDTTELAIFETVSAQTTTPNAIRRTAPGASSQVSSEAITFVELVTALTTSTSLSGSSWVRYDAQDYYSSGGGTMTLSHWIHEQNGAHSEFSPPKHITRISSIVSYTSATRTANTEWRIQGY